VQYIVPCSVGARIASAARNDRCFGLRDEGGGGVVDEHVERRIAPDRVHHGIDGSAVAQVASDDAHLAAEFAAQLRRRLFEQFKPAAADDQFGAELDEAASHRRSKPGAAAGDQYAFPRQQAFFKHRFKILFTPPTSSLRNGFAVIAGGAASSPRLEG
jgi:hypothetical protein